MKKAPIMFQLRMLTILLVGIIALLGGFTFWHSNALYNSLEVSNQFTTDTADDAGQEVSEVKPLISEYSQLTKQLADIYKNAGKTKATDEKSAKAAEKAAAVEAETLIVKADVVSRDINQRLNQITAKMESSSAKSANANKGSNTLFMIGSISFLSIMIGFLFSLWSLKNLKSSLGKFLNQVALANENISSVSERLSTANNLFSSTTTMGAVTWQEAATSIENLSVLAAANSESALHTAKAFTEKVELGQKEILNLGNEELKLGITSQKMEEVINSIDEIAFEMSLLALNATTEAAKAGEQGKGFTVIAGSIRTLSERSSAAAKDISLMIKESLSQIEANSVLVENSKQALDGILTSIKEIASQNELIVTAIASQAEGIKQIGYSMSQLDSVSQRTITGTQEISAISNLVVDESSRLESLVQTLNHKFIGETKSDL